MLCFPVSWEQLKGFWRGQPAATEPEPAYPARSREEPPGTQQRAVKSHEEDPLLSQPQLVPSLRTSRPSSETAASSAGGPNNYGTVNSPRSVDSHSPSVNTLAPSTPKRDRPERSGVTVRTDVSPSSQVRYGPKPIKDDPSNDDPGKSDQDFSSIGGGFDQQGSSSTLNGPLTLATSSVSQEKLEDKLWNARIEWPKGAYRYFVPADALEQLITSQSISMELRRCGVTVPPAELREVVAEILEKASHLFAILVCLSMGHTILGFLEEGLGDDDLPFIRAEIQPEGNAYKLRSRRRKDKPILCMADWGRTHIETFSANQWWMLAPVFKENPIVRHYPLEDNHVLPFIEDNERHDVSEGGFSTVWAVVVHPAHQFIYKSTNSPNPMIALKRLHSKVKAKFETEVEMLKFFTNKHQHAHLVKLLATYSFQGRFYLMFPKASANLREYWEQIQTPEFSTETVDWMLTQCKGIASGLAAIHTYRASIDKNNPSEEPPKKSGYLGEDLPPIGAEGSKPAKKKDLYGRHGDIKPENILISDEDVRDELGHPNKLGILLIADFGLMEFHSDKTRSLGNPEGVGGSPTYEPPDRILRLNISRAYDIWSLGCVYLEFITWLVASYTELARFPSVRGHTVYDVPINDDTFFTILPEEGNQPNRAIVREQVTEWMLDLHEKPRCSQFVHDFVHLISQQMLVVDPHKRIHCDQLNVKLKDMCLRARADPDYLLKPCPNPPRERNAVAKQMSTVGRQDGKDESPPPNPKTDEGRALPKRDVLHNLDTTISMSPPMRPLTPRRSFSPPLMGLHSRTPSIRQQMPRSPVLRPNSPNLSVRITQHPD